MIRRAYIIFFLFIVCCISLFTRPLSAAGIKKVVIKNEKEFFANIKTTNTLLDIQGNVNLNGKTHYLSKECSIIISSGQIINGSLVGHNTRFSVKKSASIGIKILGTWVSPIIDDSFFISDHLSDDDIFNNINNLQSCDILNTIYLKKKQYNISIKENGGYALRLLDNCKLINNSVIRLRGNDFESYSILYIYGASNIDISGGKIKGDVGRHTYVEGSSSEWGMGINISASNNVVIHDALISHCTGDGIYITGLPTDYIGDYSKASKNIILKKVVCDNNRRQGLSVISVDGLLVDECEFMNTGKIEKTSPAAGIDIEPNVDKGRNNSVRNIRINNCVFKNNEGRPFDVDLGVTDGKIDNYEKIIVSNCKADGPFFFGAPNVSVYNTSFESIIIRPFEAPVNCHFENCNIYGSGIIIKDVLKHDILYFNKSPKSLGTITLKGCKLKYKSSALNKTNKLIYFETPPKNKVSISFDSCNIIVPTRSSVQARNRRNISVKVIGCDIKEAQ